jgi:hypothetical protein
VHDCVFLGSDEWGDWVGQRAGWRSARPGRDLRAEGDSVTLLPPGGEFAATVNDAHPRIRVYIDLAWDVGWDAATGDPVGIDMDLDVVKAHDGRGVWIDDRDEWDEHRVALGYPPDIVQRLEKVADDLQRQVVAGRPPYDDATAERWLTVLRGLGSNDRTA